VNPVIARIYDRRTQTIAKMTAEQLSWGSAARARQLAARIDTQRAAQRMATLTSGSEKVWWQKLATSWAARQRWANTIAIGTGSTGVSAVPSPLWAATPNPSDTGANWVDYTAINFNSVSSVEDFPGTIGNAPDGAPSLHASWVLGAFYGFSNICEQLVSLDPAFRGSVSLKYRVYLDPAIDYTLVTTASSQTQAILTFPGLVGGQLWPGRNDHAYPAGGEPMEGDNWSARIRMAKSGKLGPYLYVQNKPGAFGWHRTSDHALRINDLRGRWSLWEQICVMNTPGVANGRCIFRVDGDLIVDVSDIIYRSQGFDAVVVNGMRLQAYVEGGETDPAAFAFSYWLRDFSMEYVLSSSLPPIGPPPAPAPTPNPDSFTVLEGSSQALLDVAANDIGVVGVRNLAVSSQPARGTVSVLENDSSAAKLAWADTGTGSGSTSFTYRINGSVPATVSLTITAVTLPAWQDVGVRNDRTSPANALTPAYPAGPATSGDFFFCHIAIHADSNQNAVASSSDWEEVGRVVVGDLGNFVFRKVAAGGETSATTAPSFTWTGTAVGSPTTFPVATSWITRYRCAGFENVAMTNGTGTSATFPTVTADGAKRLAIAFLAINGPATSETNPAGAGSPGGNWTWRDRDGTTSGDDAAVFLYEANLTSSNLVIAGSVTQNAGDRWSIIGLALAPVNAASTVFYNDILLATAPNALYKFDGSLTDSIGDRDAVSQTGTPAFTTSLPTGGTQSFNTGAGSWAQADKAV
jgi:hypothetical protein